MRRDRRFGRGLLAGLITLTGALLLVQLGAPRVARSLSCPASVGPMRPAPVYSVDLRADQTALDAPASIDLFGRFSWGICTGLGPKVTLEARTPGGEFGPAGGVAIYRRGNGWSCNGLPGSPPPLQPGPAVPCTIDWGSEVLSYVAAPAETTEYRLRVGPLTSEIVTITVAHPRPEVERCHEVPHYLAKPLLQAVPERGRIVFGESVRVRGTFAYELCDRLLHPQTRPGIESLGAGARFPYQPARRLVAGPVRETNGDLVWEFAPVQTTSYRLHFGGDFGEFETRVEVAPKLELEAGRARAGRVPVRIQARASTALRGAQMTLERRTASAWKPLRTLTLDRQLSASTQIAVGSSDVELRVTVPATLHHAPAASKPLLIPGG